ncbi:hypothetical protein TrRE_jg4401, partial [Triparma retinervis]
MSHVHVVMRLRSHRCHLELMNNHIKKMQEVQEMNSELLRATNKELRHYKDTAALCPITQEPITNEVVNVVDGFKYERSAILHWLTTGSETSPITRDLTLVSDIHTLRSLCAELHRLNEVRGESTWLKDLLDEERQGRRRDREALERATRELRAQLSIITTRNSELVVEKVDLGSE